MVLFKIPSTPTPSITTLKSILVRCSSEYITYGSYIILFSFVKPRNLEVEEQPLRSAALLTGAPRERHSASCRTERNYVCIWTKQFIHYCLAIEERVLPHASSMSTVENTTNLNRGFCWVQQWLCNFNCPLKCVVPLVITKAQHR